MFYLYAVVLIIINLVCLSSVIVNMPGNWLMVAMTLLFALWQRHHDPAVFSTAVIVAIVVLAALGEIIDFTLGPVVARRSGAHPRALWGTFLGGIIGAIAGTIFIPIPVVGSLLGTGLGAAAGAILGQPPNPQDARAAARIGFAAGLGSFAGTTIKLCCGLLIWLLTTLAVLIP